MNPRRPLHETLAHRLLHLAIGTVLILAAGAWFGYIIAQWIIGG